MKYSEYNLESIINNSYKKICKMFFDLSETEEQKERLISILRDGGYKDYSISSHISSKDNPTVEMRRRISMANLIIQNKEVFDKLVEKKVNIFHGTNANALPSILAHGINSFDESQRKGIYVTTGERSTRTQGRDFISFTDVLDVAEDYSSLNSYKDEENLSFEVIIGTTKEEIEKVSQIRVPSDVPEIGVKKHFPKESIKVICVPPSKVNYVKKLVGKDIEVLGIKNIKNKFYYVDDIGLIEIYEENYKKLKEKEQEYEKVFKLSELKKFVYKKFLSKPKQEEKENQIK